MNSIHGILDIWPALFVSVPSTQIHTRHGRIPQIHNIDCTVIDMCVECLQSLTEAWHYKLSFTLYWSFRLWYGFRGDKDCCGAPGHTHGGSHWVTAAFLCTSVCWRNHERVHVQGFDACMPEKEWACIHPNPPSPISALLRNSAWGALRLGWVCGGVCVQARHAALQERCHLTITTIDHTQVLLSYCSTSQAGWVGSSHCMVTRCMYLCMDTCDS